MGTETKANNGGGYAQPKITVKLNNPLMGTETWIKHLEYSHKNLYNVKLNNPLMGTETIIILSYHLKRLYICTVKLNNPLMGTETSIPPYMVTHQNQTH